VTLPSPIHVVARHWAKPEHVQAVHAVLTSLIAPSRAEPGCLKYELFQNANDPTDFTFVETFASDAALEAHAAAAYITEIPARLQGLTARPSEVNRYRPA
jgi:quinol monooxygenase YgiN